MASVATTKIAKPRKAESSLVVEAKPLLSTNGFDSVGVKKARRVSKGTGVGSNYAKMFRATPFERIDIIRRGIPAGVVIETSEAMGLPKEWILRTLHFTRATVNRRIKDKGALPTEYSERIIGLHTLIGQVEIMVAESGDPSGFNAARWVAGWLEQPVPALNNAKPADFMDTIEGQQLVSSLLGKVQSGAYA